MPFEFPTDSPLFDDLRSEGGLTYGALVRIEDDTVDVVFPSPRYPLKFQLVEDLPVFVFGETEYFLAGSPIQAMTWPALDLVLFRGRTGSAKIDLFGSAAQAVQALYARVGRRDFSADTAQALLDRLGYDPKYTCDYIQQEVRGKERATDLPDGRPIYF